MAKRSGLGKRVRRGPASTGRAVSPGKRSTVDRFSVRDSRGGSESPWFRVLFVLGLSVVMLGAAQLGLRWWAVSQARSTVARLKTASDEEVPVLVQKLDALDAAGGDYLVELLTSRRPTVIDATHKRLNQRLDRWRSLSARQSGSQVADLAEDLAETVDSMPPGGRRYAGQLATQILVWPLDESFDSTSLVRHCDYVLRSGISADSIGYSTESSRTEGVGASVRTENLDAGLPLDWSEPLLPGGDLPLDPVQLPSVPVDDAAPLEPPRRFTASENSMSLPEAMLPLPIPTLAEPRPVRDPAVAPPTPRVGHLESLTSKSHIELFRRLHLSDFDQRDQAFAELLRRGFTGEMIELGAKVTSPDSATRAAIAEELRGRNDLDPLPWLRYLSDDVDLGVQREALLGLSAMGDPFERRLALEKLDSLGGKGGSRP